MAQPGRPVIEQAYGVSPSGLEASKALLYPLQSEAFSKTVLTEEMLDVHRRDGPLIVQLEDAKRQRLGAAQC